MTKFFYCTVFCSSEEPETPFIFHKMAENLEIAQEAALTWFKNKLISHGYDAESAETAVHERSVTTVLVPGHAHHNIR